MKLFDVKEFVVQDIVYMFNDLIFVINVDGVYGKYLMIIDKVKSEVVKVGQKFKEMKGCVECKVVGEVKNCIFEFDKVVIEFVDWVEKVMVVQEF